MFTRPDDLDESVLDAALRTGWGFSSTSLTYQPVGFGSHHWLAVDAAGTRRFVTVDDLRGRLRSVEDTTDMAYARLTSAIAASYSLRELDFVAAPIPTGDGTLLRRLSDRYSVVVHAFLTGANATDDDLPAIVDRVAELHRAQVPVAPVDDFAVPNRDRLVSLIESVGTPWSTGPYAERARSLLAKHADGLRALMRAYDGMAARVAARPDRMVLTHGEPGPNNVMMTPTGPMLVDWESALLAPPERDLWDLVETGGDWVIERYTAASGIEVDREALACCRLYYDLFE
ncbi:MAG TPA: aminoglycoside phosphotransferase family protein, partial [Micromonosporaceae bacterium]